MRELNSEVSGHHLLLCHWVTERALIIAMRVEARALGPVAMGIGEPEEEDELVEEELGVKQRGGGWGWTGSSSVPLSGGDGEGWWWKGR